MRYVLAMIVAAAAALTVMLTISGPVSSFVVGLFAFESPDQDSNLEAAVFIGTIFAAILVGFGIGWALGGNLDEDDSTV